MNTDLSVTEKMKWFSTAVTLMAALTIVEGLYPASIYLWNLGLVCWLITAIVWREWSLVVVNAGLLLAYFYGLLRIL